MFARFQLEIRLAGTMIRIGPFRGLKPADGRASTHGQAKKNGLDGDLASLF